MPVLGQRQPECGRGHPNTPDSRASNGGCQECKNTRARERYQERLEWERNKSTAKHRRSRLKVLEHYGRRCYCPGCSVTTPEFLAVEHIHGGGSAHRKKVYNIYAWLIRNNFPEGFELLCHNCNCAKGFYGNCPHNTTGEQHG